MKVHSIENIIIVDDFFTTDEIIELEDWAYNRPDYRMTNDKDGYMFSFASHQWGGYENYDETTKKIIDKFKDEFPFEVPDFAHVLLNCLGINQFCETHQDTPTGGLSIIVYLNSEWKFNWAGDTYFINNLDPDYSISVIPKPGRIIISPGETWHGSRAPSQFMQAKGRLTLVFQYSTPDKTEFGIKNVLNAFVQGCKR